MNINFKDLDNLNKYESLDSYIKEVFTGNALNETVKYQYKEFFLMNAEAQKVYEQFGAYIDLIVSESEMKGEVIAFLGIDEEEFEKDPYNQEVLELAMVNEAILASCVNIHEKMKDKINKKNENKSLQQIHEDYLASKEFSIDIK